MNRWHSTFTKSCSIHSKGRDSNDLIYVLRLIFLFSWWMTSPHKLPPRVVDLGPTSTWLRWRVLILLADSYCTPTRKSRVRRANCARSEVRARVGDKPFKNSWSYYKQASSTSVGFTERGTWQEIEEIWTITNPPLSSQWTSSAREWWVKTSWTKYLHLAQTLGC